MPPICSVLGASQSTLADDTERLQKAIDACASGFAVRLSARNQHSAFVSGPITLRSGVSLAIDAEVTLFASLDPVRYDRGAHTCGTNDLSGKGCKPFISAENTQGSGIFGEGSIDGQGGQVITGATESWWQLARRAQKENTRQNVPRLIEITRSKNFSLHRTILRNAANFHVVLNQVDGFTAWGIRIDTPSTARNTDGIDPISSRNITIAYSAIRTGDDNIAIKAGNHGPSEHISILHNHFYSGHGMSIGSETNGGVQHVLVDDLTMDGTTSGLRIKSNATRGGLVKHVRYQNVCLRNVHSPIEFDTHYDRQSVGDLIPHYLDIALSNVHSLTPGRVILRGFDAQHALQVKFEQVVVNGKSSEQGQDGFELTHARIDNSSQSAPPVIDCTDRFVAFPAELKRVKRPQLSPEQAKSFSMLEVLKMTGEGGQETIDPWNPLAQPRLSGEHVQPDYIVDLQAKADGRALFNSVQAAVSRAVTDARTSQRKSRITILVKPGVYQELVYVPASAPITLLGIGADASSTKISARLDAALSGADYVKQFAGQFSAVDPDILAMYLSLKDRPTLGTFGTAVAWIKNDGFQAKNISIENAYNKAQGNAREECPQGVCGDQGIYAQTLLVHHQALAVMVDGADKVQFDYVRLLGFQDTLYLKSPKPGSTVRSFFYKSYIEGDVDFIFGDATAYFYQSEIKSLGDRTNSYVGAPSTSIKTAYGFVFNDCTFTHDGTANALAGKFNLARQWPHNLRCTPYAAVPVEGYACQLGDINIYQPPQGSITQTTLEAVGKMVVMHSRIGSHIHHMEPWANWNKLGTLVYRPAQFGTDDFTNNLKQAKIDPQRISTARPASAAAVFLAEFDNSDE